MWVCVPHLNPGMTGEENNIILSQLLDKFLQNKDCTDFTFWYYTPMAREFTHKYNPGLTVYDCMDELSAFKYAPKELRILEKELLATADIVFTGGHSLYEAKKNQHANIYPFPSSIDKQHFEKARKVKNEPEDQRFIAGPKIGFYGVLDERFDLNLIRDVAKAKPEWQIILIGPVAKIDEKSLPVLPNIHYLGQKTYEQLPSYLSGWQAALIPFQLNESTRYISPTKTPEYLAAGLPVVSTPIRDVVDPYGRQKLVSIASTAAEFTAAIEKELSVSSKQDWLRKVDSFLNAISWDITCSAMIKLLEETVEGKNKLFIAS